MQKEKLFCYKYPRPSYTADCMIFNNFSENFHILLIKRRNEPYRNLWALPGGFVEPDELGMDAAKRELFEETGLENNSLKEFHVYDKPGRDPRGRTVTVVFYSFVAEETLLIKAGDDAKEVKWFSLKHLPTLAFDHNEIIDRALLELPELVQ